MCAEEEETAFEVLSPDERRLLVAFQEHAVRAVVVGGYAARVHGVREHGYLRAVEDLDLVIDTGAKNLGRLREALVALRVRKADEIVGGFGRSPKAKWRWRNGNDDHFVDVLSKVDPFSFDVIAAAAIDVSDADLHLRVMARQHLIEAKRAALSDPGRGEKSQRDQKDLEALLGDDQVF